MEMTGAVSGMIELLGGGEGEVKDVQVKQITEYNSVVDEEKVAKIDLSLYINQTKLNQELSDLEGNIDQDYQKKSDMNDYVLKTALEQNYTNNTTLVQLLDNKQDNLIAGDGIDITGNTISATGGSGGGLDLPTDSTPVAIGTFGNMTIYMQYIDVFVGSSSTYDVWIGQNADIVLCYKVFIMSPSNKGSLISIPFSDDALNCSFITNIWTVNPTIKVSTNIKQNWLSDARCRGVIIFAR